MVVGEKPKETGIEIFVNTINDVAKDKCSWCIFNAHKKECCHDCRSGNSFNLRTEKVFDKYEELIKFLEEKIWNQKMSLEEIKKEIQRGKVQ